MDRMTKVTEALRMYFINLKYITHYFKGITLYLIVKFGPNRHKTACKIIV